MLAGNWEILHLYGGRDSFSHIFPTRDSRLLIFHPPPPPPTHTHTCDFFRSVFLTFPTCNTNLASHWSKKEQNIEWPGKMKTKSIDDEPAKFCGKISKLHWRNRALPGVHPAAFEPLPGRQERARAQLRAPNACMLSWFYFIERNCMIVFKVVVTVLALQYMYHGRHYCMTLASRVYLVSLQAKLRITYESARYCEDRAK